MNAKNLSRLAVYAVLLIAALFFLAPLYVMLATSFKDAEQIRSGNLLSLPHGLNFESWTLAWSTACTGVDCRGLKPYFMNSVMMAVPAVLISTAWGAVNGYVLSMWKFRGSELLFGFLLFGVFMPFQVVLLPMSWVSWACRVPLPGWCWCTAWRAWPEPRCFSETTTPPFRVSWSMRRAWTARVSGAFLCAS